MYGSHLSIAGGMVNALEEAQRQRMDCVQVFTKNQRQWRVVPLKEDDLQAWLQALHEMGWDDAGGPPRVVSHNSYLINMASPDPEAWKKSVALQRIELQRCETLKIPLCVAHPGAHMGTSPPTGHPHCFDRPLSKDQKRGLGSIVKALDAIHADLPGYKVVTCLETTVGSGTNLGWKFEHLAWIRDHVKEPDRVGYCVDTCHITAAGYDLTTDANAKAVMSDLDATCGNENVKVFHMNDSIGAVGSRRDRHAHIGEGTCGRSCFRAIVSSPAFIDVPKILETAKGQTPKGTELDTVNIRRLKRLAKAR
jgi:deoxyribonuclease-4